MNRRFLPSAAGVLTIAFLAGGMGRAPQGASATAAGPAVRIRLVVCIKNLDTTGHPIRVSIDGRPVFNRVMRGPGYLNGLFPRRCRTRTLRLATGDHQVETEESITHVVQRTPISVSRPGELRVGFWPWYQNGLFRQEPHFTVALEATGGQRAP